MFRGWDDRVLWSIDSYLAKMISIWLKEFKEKKSGVPLSILNMEDYPEVDWTEGVPDYVVDDAKKKYDEILDEIIESFELYNEYAYETFDYEEKDKLGKKFYHGFDLLRKHFETFWD